MNYLKKLFPKGLIVMLIISMVAMAGCSKNDDKKEETTNKTENEEKTETDIADGSKNNEKLVVTIGDKEVYLDEAMYYIYALEAQYSYYDQMYQAYFGQNYWDMEIEDGVTNRQAIKDLVIQTIQMYEVLYDQAVKANYTLTEEDNTNIATNTTSFVDSLLDKQKEVMGITAEKVTEIQKKLALADKYYEFLIDSFNIKEEDIKKELKPEDYRQYKTQYLRVSLEKFDDAGNPVAIKEDEKKKLKSNIEAAYKKVKAGKDFAKIAEKNEYLSTAEQNFVKGDESIEEAYQKAAMKLKNDEISDIVETETGFYIIKMINDNSEDAYNEAVQNKVLEAQNEAFGNKFTELSADYAVTVNTEVWDDIVMGEVTIIPEEPTESPAADGATEPTESPAADGATEPTESPAADGATEPTESPAADSVTEPTESPAADSVTEPTESPAAE